mmetsp:Transcript_8963/g.22963  ORF Transcript_8963/g.22963 Transcript_8963/m.22963 type:complete len:272 (+) Transcript_8963:1679-2494(+)
MPISTRMRFSVSISVLSSGSSGASDSSGLCKVVPPQDTPAVTPPDAEGEAAAFCGLGALVLTVRCSWLARLVQWPALWTDTNRGIAFSSSAGGAGLLASEAASSRDAWEVAVEENSPYRLERRRDRPAPPDEDGAGSRVTEGSASESSASSNGLGSSSSPTPKGLSSSARVSTGIFTIDSREVAEVRLGWRCMMARPELPAASRDALLPAKRSCWSACASSSTLLRLPWRAFSSGSLMSKNSAVPLGPSLPARWLVPGAGVCGSLCECAPG